jgi:wyosine [tRNA(Phe)-imidazoG37] synthetase (radical SAM superfamily)
MADDTYQIRSNLAVVQDHSRHFADFTFVYPVISRRSRGLSIGVNVNPDKVCNFDCVYCEVDRSQPGKVSRLDLRQMRDELLAMIQFAREGGLALEPKFNEVPWLTRDIKDIAFSGEGEPTLISNFSDCVRIVAEVKRIEKLDKTRIVLVTDAAGLDKADVKLGLEIMDANQGEIWGKLDAGTETYFKQVNRSTVRFERILKNLLSTACARPIVIQTLLLKMNGLPMAATELAAYCDRLNEMTAAGAQIREIHAYTVARPAPEQFVSKLSQHELDGFAEIIHGNTGLKVFAFA